jgi:hypothetical protein
MLRIGVAGNELGPRVATIVTARTSSTTATGVPSRTTSRPPPAPRCHREHRRREPGMSTNSPVTAQLRKAPSESAPKTRAHRRSREAGSCTGDKKGLLLRRHQA